MAIRRLFPICAAILIGIACTTSAAVPSAKRITWGDLRPDDQPGRFVETPGTVDGSRQGEALVWQGGAHPVVLTGFLLPVDRDGDLIHEFILVPWAGACSHSASPPPNQMILVFPEEPFRSARIYEAITVSGNLRPGLDKAQLFVLDGTRVLTYGYRMGQAKVTRATKLDDPDVRALPPGGLLSR
jgi:uncharacterized protein